MGTGRRVACLLAFLGCGWAGSLPAPREYSHRIWRVQDGLPQNRILAISQTADGYLWIGTSGGLPDTAFYDRSGALCFLKQGTFAKQSELAEYVQRYALREECEGG